nr:zinc finger, CCHC-type [Tanacetum cinerariifolium]
MTPKNFGFEFQLYLIEGTRDEVFDQHSNCINVEDDPKTFNEAIKSQDVAYWKKAINDEMDIVIGVRSKSIAATWLEKVVTPLIEPAIKGFAAASAFLKPERLRVDRHGMSESMSYYLID